MANFPKDQGPLRIRKFCVYSYEHVLAEVQGILKQNEKVVSLLEDFDHFPYKFLFIC